MPRTKTKRTGTKSASGEPSKAQQIRDAAKTLGKKVRPRDIVAALKEKGTTVTSAQVSTTLSAAGYRRKRRGKKAAATTTAPAVQNSLNVEGLVAAKVLL